MERERGSCEAKKGHCSAPSTAPSVATEQATKGHEGEAVQRYGRATLHLLWGALALRKTEMEKLGALHRKQLKYVLGVFYPAHLSSIEAYSQAATTPVSVKCVAARLSLMGHVLRGAAESDRAAYSAMTAYFRRRAAQGEGPRARTRRGRVLTTIQRVTHLDMQLVGRARRAAMPGAEGLETGTDLAAKGSSG